MTCQIDMYLYVRITLRIDTAILTRTRKKYPVPGDDASTADAAAGRVGTGEQGEARRANSTPNGGPHLELS